MQWLRKNDHSYSICQCFLILDSKYYNIINENCIFTSDQNREANFNFLSFKILSENWLLHTGLVNNYSKSYMDYGG